MFRVRPTPDPIDRLEALIERFEAAAAHAPEFATVAQASRLLGIGIKAVRGAIHRGELLVYHLGTRSGGRLRVHVPEVRAWALSTAFDPLAEARAAGDAAGREITPSRVLRARRGVQSSPKR